MKEMSRRRFLQAASAWAGGIVLSGALPKAATGAQPAPLLPSTLDGTRRILTPLINTYARLEDDAWALMHGVRAMGPGFSIKGANAVDLLCSRVLKRKRVAGGSYLYMPVEQEGHSNAFLKTVLEAGVSPSHRFKLDGRRYTIGDLVSHAKGLFTFDPKTIDRDEIAWTLIAFSLQIPPSHDTWTNAYGQRIRFADVVRFGFDTLDETTQEFRRAKARGVMPEEKDAIMAFTCGGTHLVYGLASCVGNGHGGEELRRRLKDHLDLHIWRLHADGYLMERFYRQATPPPGLERIYDLFFRDAVIKFYGHSFEILSYVKHRRLWTPTADQAHAIERAGVTLANAVKGIEGVDLFEFRRTNLRLFHLLVGDSCHAYHGIHMAPGVNQV
ncbi:MAG: hypothetical protein HY574_00370 [candidate division NC10 bacterium]|nr:hypothetical protein [candidate division NC10 bacterium]